MKLRACILILIWSLLLVQPVFSNFGGKTAYTFCKKNVDSGGSCSKEIPKKSSCSKEEEEKPCDQEEKKDSGTRNCNPTLGCSSGNFYTVVHSHIIIAKLPLTIQKLVLSNDNRLATQLSECWHPPELIS